MFRNLTKRCFGTTIAHVFPGQGACRVGMAADLSDQFPIAKRVLEEVDDAIMFPLSKLMREGPAVSTFLFHFHKFQSELMLTANQQPALLAHAMAIDAILKVAFRFFFVNKSLNPLLSRVNLALQFQTPKEWCLGIRPAK